MPNSTTSKYYHVWYVCLCMHGTCMCVWECVHTCMYIVHVCVCRVVCVVCVYDVCVVCICVCTCMYVGVCVYVWCAYVCVCVWVWGFCLHFGPCTHFISTQLWDTRYKGAVQSFNNTYQVKPVVTI